MFDAGHYQSSQGEQSRNQSKDKGANGFRTPGIPGNWGDIGMGRVCHFQK